MLQEATIQEKAAARSTLLLRTGMQQLLLNPRRVVAAFLEASCAKGWEPRSFLYAYQFWPSPPISLAINAATLSSRLPFNMSVTSLRDTRPREVASLAMAYQTLRSTAVRSSPLAPLQRRPGSPFLSPFC
jgi:hypothetical protein